MPSLRVEGDIEVAAALSAKATVQLPLQIQETVRHWAGILESRIKGRASGRPGPNIRTGNYIRSWTTELVLAGVHATAEVGTNAPQGRRLEFGFVGVDSRGRHYNQPPLPHVRPSIPEVEAGFYATLETIASEI